MGAPASGARGVFPEADPTAVMAVREAALSSVPGPGLAPCWMLPGEAFTKPAEGGTAAARISMADAVLTW